MDPLARTFHALPKCTTHVGALLTSEGACPTCERTATALRPERPDTKHIPRPPSKKAHVAAQAHGRISAGKPRARRAA